MPYRTKKLKNEYMRNWKKKNKNKVREWNKAYVAKDPERWKEWHRKWEKENYEYRKATARRTEFTCENCNKKTFGFRKSQRFCSRKCMGLGYRTGVNRYLRLYRPKHHEASFEGKVLEHRLIAEKMIGRKLNKHEVVHHKNHKRNDNRPKNLQVMNSVEHSRMHALERNRKLK